MRMILCVLTWFLQVGYYPETDQESCIAHLRANRTATDGVYRITNGNHSYDACTLLAICFLCCC
jgi:hypothetical protein